MIHGEKDWNAPYETSHAETLNEAPSQHHDDVDDDNDDDDDDAIAKLFKMCSKAIGKFTSGIIIKSTFNMYNLQISL